MTVYAIGEAGYVVRAGSHNKSTKGLHKWVRFPPPSNNNLH